MKEELALKASQLLKEAASTLRSVDTQVSDNSNAESIRVLSLDIEALRGA